MKIKSLYKGVFIFNNSIRIERTMAYSEQQAKVLLINRIAKKQGVPVSMVWDKFRDGGAEIKLEVEYEED